MFMQGKRKKMHHIREILRLMGAGSEREIAASVGAAHSTVGDIWRKARALGLDWQAARAMSDEDLAVALSRGGSTVRR
jgi:hypothetical protein